MSLKILVKICIKFCRNASNMFCYSIYRQMERDACVFLPKIHSGMRIPDGDLPISNDCHLLLASIPGESVRRF
jgi:hypothetical protein